MEVLRKKALLMILFLMPFYAVAEKNNCAIDASRCSNTPLGLLVLKSKGDMNDDHSHIILNNVDIYKAKTDYMVFYWDDEFVKKNGRYLVTKAIISYSSWGACTDEYGEKFNCHANILIDLTGSNPIISNEFFSETGFSDIDWISWGKLNSVVVFKDGSKFKYSKGHIERVNGEKNQELSQ